MKRSHFFLFVLLISACSNDKGQAQTEQTKFSDIPVSFAQGFQIEDKGTHRELILTETTDGSEYARYFLVDKSKPVPDGLDSNFVLRTPVQSVVCASTTHASYFAAVEGVDEIVGLPYTDKVMDEILVEAIGKGQIKDVTGSPDIDFEQLLALGPELVIIYPNLAKMTEKLWEADISVMLFSEHSEPHPLGRAEWVKVVGELLGTPSIAEQCYLEERSKYLEYKMHVAYSSYKPSVFFGSAWKGVWYAPGGRSASAQLLRDAGASYLFQDNDGISNMQMDIEVLFDKGYNADFWGMVQSGDPNAFIDEMHRSDPRMLTLKPVQERKIFFCDTESSDYFGRASLEPHLMLADMIKVFHPKYLPNHEPVYFQALED